VFNTTIAVEPKIRDFVSERTGKPARVITLVCPEELKDKTTKWVHVKIWDDKLQEKLLKFGDLRRRIQVVGPLTFSSYEDRETKEEKEIVEINCLNFTFQDKRREEGDRVPSKPVYENKVKEKKNYQYEGDDDCPF
jgi:single-stranded DNA-binding protein